MRTLALFFIYTFLAYANAESLESHYLDAVSSAHTSEQVEALKHKYEQIKIAHVACEIQLYERLVPIACYEELALQKDLSDRADRVKRLDALCLFASQKLQRNVELTPSVSPFCAAKVHAARTIQVYREQEVWIR